MAGKGILLVVSGFSGAGKGTLLQKLLEKYDTYVINDQRSSNVRIEAMIAAGELIEYACYVGNYYGTPKAYVEEQLALGKDVILEIEIQGARKIKECYPDSVLLFLSPPSAEELRRRLTGRGTESMEVIENRLSRAAQEAQGIEDYDYFVINDNIEDCVQQVHQILESEHSRSFRNGERIGKIREEVGKFQK